MNYIKIIFIFASIKTVTQLLEMEFKFDKISAQLNK